MTFSPTLHDDDKGWRQEALLCWLLLGDYGHYTWYDNDVIWKQEELLWWFPLREYGSHTWFDDSMAWQQEALLQWILLEEYSLTFFMSAHMSLLLIFHYVDVMFGSYMANRGNDESID